MGLLLGEALKRLCSEIGWSYAVFWKAIHCGNSRHLVWAEGHHEPARASAATGNSMLEATESLKDCGALRTNGGVPDPLADLTCRAEGRVGDLVDKMMRSQVHVVGDGVVGRAAVTGNHQWILQSGERYVTEGLDEMNHHFFAGIKTIAVIPVLPHGVVQLGSIQMIMENFAFIEHVKQFFMQLGCMPGALLSDGIQKDVDLKNVPSIPALPSSLDPSGTACSNLSNHLSFKSEHSVPPINKFPIISALAQYPCMSRKSSFERFNSKLATSAVGMSIHNCTDRTVVPSIIHHNSRLEGQAVLSNAHLQFQQTPISGSSCGSQHQDSLAGSSLSSSSLSYLEGQLLLNIGQQRFLRSPAILDSTKPSQLQPHGDTVPTALKDSMLLGGREELSNHRNHFRTSGTLPCSMGLDTIGIQNMNLYGIATTQVLSSTYRSSGNCGNSAPADATRSSMDKHSESMSTVTMSHIGSDLFQVLENQCIIPKSSTPHPEPPANSVQDCWVNGSNLIRSTQDCKSYVCGGSSTSASIYGQKDNGEHKCVSMVGDCTPDEHIPHTSGDDLFDVLGKDFKSKHCSGNLNSFSVNGNDLGAGESGLDLSTCINQLELDPVFEQMHDGISSCSGIFSETGPDQLLDAVVSKISSGAKKISIVDPYCNSAITKANNSLVYASSNECGWASLQQQMHGEHFGLPPPVLKTEAASSSVKSAGSVDKTGECSQKDATCKSQISLWVENGQNRKIDSMLSAQCKRIDEIGKSNRKRPRPGESPRPRPKDRQMIQDRVKELREIVPNGAKCSIDALLERTIKHMLFLQSVTKHADKLKETGEPKIISKEGGLLLKDNFEGGATWAFEVGTRSMVCPIIVEDLNPPRQLLVEMLCEERGFFLEIADLIRGLGLTILKGVMEARNDKVWARFAVEANRDVTRMDIFMSLVRLLEPAAGSGIAAQGFDNSNIPCNMVCQASIPATGLANRMQ